MAQNNRFFNLGFGGGGGFGDAGCRYWCRTPEGQAYCCEGNQQPPSPVVGVKPGQCPPVRLQCPRTPASDPLAPAPTMPGVPVKTSVASTSVWENTCANLPFTSANKTNGKLYDVCWLMLTLYTLMTNKYIC